MPKHHCAAPELASLLDGSSAVELIPELARHGLQPPPDRSGPVSGSHGGLHRWRLHPQG
jgi:hypothetical protein